MPPGIRTPVAIQVAFEVNGEGGISNCTPVTPTALNSSERKKAERAIDALGSQACASILTDYRAEPAADNHGRRIRSIQTIRVTFATP